MKSALLLFRGKSETEIQAHALRQLIEIAKRKLAASRSPALAVRALTELGLHRIDAGRIVLSLEEPSAGNAPSDILSLLGEGSLREARRLLATLGSAAPEEEVKSLTTKIEAAEAYVTDLRKQALAAAKLSLIHI